MKYLPDLFDAFLANIPNHSFDHGDPFIGYAYVGPGQSS
jgi:hypothetical protein